MLTFAEKYLQGSFPESCGCKPWYGDVTGKSWVFKTFRHGCDKVRYKSSTGVQQNRLCCSDVIESVTRHGESLQKACGEVLAKVANADPENPWTKFVEFCHEVVIMKIMLYWVAAALLNLFPRRICDIRWYFVYILSLICYRLQSTAALRRRSVPTMWETEDVWSSVWKIMSHRIKSLRRQTNNALR